MKKMTFLILTLISIGVVLPCLSHASGRKPPPLQERLSVGVYAQMPFFPKELGEVYWWNGRLPKVTMIASNLLPGSGYLDYVLLELTSPAANGYFSGVTAPSWISMAADAPLATMRLTACGQIARKKRDREDNVIGEECLLVTFGGPMEYTIPRGTPTTYSNSNIVSEVVTMRIQAGFTSNGQQWGYCIDYK